MGHTDKWSSSQRENWGSRIQMGLKNFLGVLNTSQHPISTRQPWRVALLIGGQPFMVYTNGVLCWHSFGLPWSMEDHTKTEEEMRGRSKYFFSQFPRGLWVGCTFFWRSQPLTDSPIRTLPFLGTSDGPTPVPSGLEVGTAGSRITCCPLPVPSGSHALPYQCPTWFPGSSQKLFLLLHLLRG